MAQKRSKTDLFKALTWNDLQEWAGTAIVSRGRSYQKNRQVQGLACTPGEGVVAWVQGTERYATMVDIEEEELVSACTCPYAGTCKHAVAVVLEYLEYLKQNTEVPMVTAKDRRLVLLQEAQDAEAWDEEDEENEEDEEEVDADHFAPGQSEKAAAGALHSFLEQQTKAQLIALLEEMAARYSVVREALQDRRDLTIGTAAELVNAVRQEIEELSAEPDWSDDWDDEGSIPDYSGVRDRLETLLAKGHADEVVALGEELLDAGTRQVEMSQDEGETAEEVSSCLNIVFRALSQSSLSPAEQMLWVVDAELNDEYDLCQGAELFWEQEHMVADWNILAEKLMQRLKQDKSKKGEDSFSRNFRRDHLSNRLIMALEHAGRHEEIIPLCEREAEKTGSYVRLINYLKEAERWEDVEQWIPKGIKATQKQWPGIANELRTALRETRERANNWLSVAAFWAEDFFGYPTLPTFQELQNASERAEVWPEVRAAAIHYLETGELHQATERATKDQIIPPWPLPETGVINTTEYQQKINPPMTAMLIEIAIAEKRPDEVIRWYDQRKPGVTSWGWSGHQDDHIAEAIVEVYPDRALAIWKKIAEAQIALTQPKFYEAAAVSLRKIYHTLEKLGREKEWQSYLTGLRQANARKRRLLEILDTLVGRRIIER
ncbi:MAG: SWIM zinc finger domain-containing protein [Candidatus Tectomicrobia bacterium]|nr:SWIM zinc finger domain-containing protein [Candidatus Tectomicrobia bacterium]